MILTLDAVNYIGVAVEVEKKTASVDREMDQLDRSVDKVERDMAELAATAKAASTQVDNLGDQARGAAASMTALDARIKATKASVRDLGLEFARTGDAVDGKAFNQEKALLNRLERLKKTLESLTPDVGGGGFASLAGKSFKIPFSGAISGEAAGIGGIFLASASPAIAAGIAGAVLGGVGIGGVVGGAVLAARDQRVKTAWAELGSGILEGLQPAQDAFVQPMIKAADTLGVAFFDSGIIEGLEKAAKLVDPLARGLAGFGRELGPGLTAAFQGALPVMNELSKDLPRVGVALSSMLKSMANVGPEGALALHDFFKVLNDGIIVTGAVIEVLAKLYPLIRPLVAEFVPLFGLAQPLALLAAGASGAVDPTDELGKALLEASEAAAKIRTESENAAKGVGTLGEAADKATIAAYRLDTAANKVYETFLLLEGDEIAVEAGIDDLSDALARNGTTLDKTTAAGRENETLLIGIAQHARDTVSDMLAHGKSVAEVNAKYGEFRGELYDTFIQAGKTAEEAQTLVDKWLALEALDDIEIGVTIQYRAIDAYLAGNIPHGFQQFAAGGVVQGPPGSAQMIVAHAGEVVLNEQQQARQWNGGGGGTTVVRHEHAIDLMVNGSSVKKLLITDALDRNIDAATVRASYP